MDVIKKNLLCITFLFSVLSFGQKKAKYPKDTIYIKFEKKIGQKKWNAKFERSYKEKKGIFFNVENDKGGMALFYNLNNKTDTLCVKHFITSQI